MSKQTGRWVWQEGTVLDDSRPMTRLEKVISAWLGFSLLLLTLVILFGQGR